LVRSATPVAATTGQRSVTLKSYLIAISRMRRRCRIDFAHCSTVGPRATGIHQVTLAPIVHLHTAQLFPAQRAARRSRVPRGYPASGFWLLASGFWRLPQSVHAEMVKKAVENFIGLESLLPGTMSPSSVRLGNSQSTGAGAARTRIPDRRRLKWQT
jgi:hypothetical protein